MSSDNDARQKSTSTYRMAKKALGYTRLSQQSDTSIARQKQHIREYGEEHEFDLVEIYDDGEFSSGFSVDDLDEYLRLRDAIRSDGELAAVIVNAKRRLPRDIDEVMRLIPAFRTNDVELHSYQDGQLDLSDPVKAAIEIVQAAAAHEEKRGEIERSVAAVEQRLESGYDHGRPRFGMQYDAEGKYQVPGEEFDTVLKILRRRSSGATYAEISEETGVSESTAKRVVDRRDWYVEREKMAETRSS